ncbi:MAG: NB-ARC domain-containing protein, partial [Chloroflexota bacterium]|nr:NB-ARC domain-containing protein [Chloroflexota bacterium]
LNRVARLLSAGSGGQTLLSTVTHELVRDQLPPGAELRDMGEHRLKDLQQPEHIFQLVAPDLPADFPPLKTLGYRPNNLPLQPTPFIGRERELAMVRQRLLQPDVRLLTLTGPGGIGKTRLALQATADLLDDFPDGVWVVNLAPISDPGLVASTIATTLGVTEVAGQPLGETLQRSLRQKHLLLLLDNFEQVLPAGPLVTDLLAAAAGLTVVVTSRARLGVYGEWDIAIPPLALPDLQHLPPLERLSQYAAVRLFLERAQAAKADFRVTTANAPAVAEICSRVDGLPLAIELAAARIRLLPPAALLQRLSHRLKLLTGGGRDRPTRHQTMRGAIEWSYGLLDAGEQTLFARLAVFVGGCTLEAVEAVCHAQQDLPVDVMDGVASLVDKNLLRPVEGREDAPRFAMLETIREYALERLGASEEAEFVQQQHAAYYLALAEEAEPKLWGAEQGVWVARLDQEHDNIRAVLRWALEQGRAELALRLGGALQRFWIVRGYLSEGRHWLEAALADSEQVPTGLRAKALDGAGWVAVQQQDYGKARSLLEQALALAREAQDPERVVLVLLGLGQTARLQGDLEQARAAYEESAGLAREAGDQWSAAFARGNLGAIAHAEGNETRAAEQLEAGIAIYRDLGDHGLVAMGLMLLGRVTKTQGDYERSAACLRESLSLFHEQLYQEGIAATLEASAGLAAAEGQAQRAARLFGSAERLREASGSSITPFERLDVDADLAAARAQLDEATWQVAWAEGRAMSLEQVIAYALEARDPAR